MFALNPDDIKNMTKLEMEVLSYIITNKNKVINMSVHELAKKCYSSTATINRICKKMGFSGFAELKFALKNSDEEEFRNSDSLQSLEYQTQKTFELLENDSILNVVNLMRDARNIHVFGKGPNNDMLEYFSRRLTSLGRFNVHHQDSNMAYLSTETMNEEDLVIVASIRGETEEVIKMVQLAKLKGATVVAVTNLKASPLEKLADYVLYVYVEQNKSNFYSNYDYRTRVPMLIVLESLCDEYKRLKFAKD